MAQQSAVEWLQERYDKCPESFLTEDDFEQAKKIEREQHNNTWIDSQIEKKGETYISKEMKFDDYYNETYKK